MRRGRLTGVMLVLLTLVFGLSDADACFCGPNCTAAAEADAIFEATVTSIEHQRRRNPNGSYSEGERIVHLADVRGWRGGTATAVRTGGGCGYPFQVGTRYVIVASPDEKDGQMRPTICSMTGPLADAGAFREYVDSLSSPSRGGHLWGRVARARVIPYSRTEPPMTIADPIVGARVSLTGPTSRTIETGADGRFNVPALPSGKYTVDVALPSGQPALGTIGSQTIALDGGYACAALDLWTRAAGVVEGTVTDEDGRPVTGFLVYLQPVGFRVFGPHRPNSVTAMGEQTDAGGRYRFTNVPPGRYLTGSSIMVGPTSREPFAVTYGRTSAGDMELVLEEGGASLSVEPIVLRRLTSRRVAGRVMWSDGQPAAGLTIGAAAVGERGTIPAVQSTTIGDRGGFTLPLFDGARFEMTVSRERRVIHRSQLVVSDEPIVITLPIP